jgi:hypothetical protein
VATQRDLFQAQVIGAHPNLIQAPLETIETRHATPEKDRLIMG